MSKAIKDVKILTIDDINKKILARAPFVRPNHDLLNTSGKYRDEEYQTYKEKKWGFLEACRRYNDINETAFVTSKKRLQKDYDTIIDELCMLMLDIPKNEEQDYQDKIDNYCPDGRLIRKRMLRTIHDKEVVKSEEFCIEPWFRRHLILKKFIHHARSVILKGRLLKNLEKLKLLDKEKVKELEKAHRKCVNETYGHLFQKFI